ncbi:biopolymer transporter ExbD [Cerasicoccus arenae]|nr:biopolymer transporter ExbD [Cerasicoccus arenae]
MPITPLIDCVFLLIIFFLVTGMFKRFEMLIPVELPDQTSALSQQASDTTVKLAIDREGQVMTSNRRIGPRNSFDYEYTPVEDFAIFLQSLDAKNRSTHPLEISVARDTPTQKVIDVLDIAQLQGFHNVSVRTLPETF